jgi:hypothetical protein
MMIMFLWRIFVCYKYVNPEKLAEWRSVRTSPDGRWVEIVSHFSTNNEPYSIVLKWVEFVLCVPGTNARTERVFSLMNSLWTSQKTQLSVETLKAVLIPRVNFECACVDFFKMLCGKSHVEEDPFLPKISVTWELGKPMWTWKLLSSKLIISLKYINYRTFKI